MGWPLKPLSHDAVTMLVVHCSSTRSDRPFSTDALINTGMTRFGQPSYHYYVRRSGEIIPILSETEQGVHARGYNHCSLGICYEGGLDPKGEPADTRTELQKRSLYKLLADLHNDYPQARIIGHCELPRVAKRCPCFPASIEYQSLQPPPAE